MVDNPEGRHRELARVRSARFRFSAQEANIADESVPTESEWYDGELSIWAPW